MCRPVTSNVSVLSDFVANGHQAMQPVSSSLPKIPYVGFSPVRLQTGHPPPPSRPATQRPLIGGCSPRGTTDPNTPLKVGAGAAHHGRSGPEALGSPSGYVVPSGHRLLRPHPPLWISLDDFGSRTYTPSLCLPAKTQSFPNLLCVSLLPCRLPYPGGPSGPNGLGTSARAGLRPIRTGSAPAMLHASRFTRGIPFGAAKFALCYGPAACSPYTGKDFYFRAFIP